MNGRAGPSSPLHFGHRIGGREPLRLFMGHGLDQLVPAVALLALRARHEEVREVVHVAGRLEARLREDRRRVDQVVVVAEA